jgi:acetyl esterase/lipase
MRRLLSLLALSASVAFAAETPAPKIKLWPNQPPGSLASETYKEDVVLRDNDPNKPRISKVTEPTLEVFLPEKANANGTAVVVCPGGGYSVLAYDHEGIQVARFFNKLGVAAFVLKYRLPSDEIMKDRSVGPLQDVQEAIRTVRRRAAEWGVNPAKIGIMGFSAGGHLAGSATTLFNLKVYEPVDATSARPDFSILVYPVISMKPGLTHGGSRKNLIGDDADATKEAQFSIEKQVTAETPPTFLVHSLDDGTVPVENSIDYALAAKQLKVPVELHLYPRGGHGYGLGVSPTSPQEWPDVLKMWLKKNGWL